MKLTTKVKQRIASEIRHKYVYMDSLPMKGWGWEFLRRNKQYVEAFGRLEEEVKTGVWDDKCRKILSGISDVAYLYGMMPNRTCSKLDETDRGNFKTLKLPHIKMDEERLNLHLRDDQIHIPRPDRRYCDFAIPSLFLPRSELHDYKIYESFKTLLYSEMDVTLFTDRNTPIEMHYNDHSENVFYIAVSKDANIVDIKEKMLKGVAKILKKHKPRVRKRKWKYYLIVYDLKQEPNDKMSYDEIAKILIDAYPEEGTTLFDETRNIINWHGKATSLIDGEFLKHLKYQI